MTTILICAGDITLESLLAVVVERMGYETEVLRSAPLQAPPRGDLLLVDPSSIHGVAWARAAHPDLPVVTVGLEAADRRALGFAPAAVVPKPFALDDLRHAVEKLLGPPR